MPDINKIIFWIFELIQYLIMARVFLSWIPIRINSQINQFIYNLTEPLLALFRRLIPFSTGGLDLSPILLLIALRVIQNLLT